MAKTPCAYCKAHKKYLTVKQMKLHQCLKKECISFQPVEHNYWTMRYNNKMKSAERKRQLYGSITDTIESIADTGL